MPKARNEYAFSVIEPDPEYISGFKCIECKKFHKYAGEYNIGVNPQIIISITCVDCIKREKSKIKF